MTKNRSFNLFAILVMVIALLSAMFVAQPVSAQDDTPPDAVTELVCKGERAIVFQSVTETGDGVTVALYSIVDGKVVPTKDPCGDESNVWAYVEPWGDEDQNADAMFVGTWAEMAEVAGANNWPNGSGWLQTDPSVMFDHPLVVKAADVTGRNTLGLNPNEDQTQAARRGWVIDRAITLLTEASMTPAEYCEAFDEKLADYLCGFPQFMDAKVTTEADPAEKAANEAPAEEAAPKVDEGTTVLETKDGRLTGNRDVIEKACTDGTAPDVFIWDADGQPYTCDTFMGGKVEGAEVKRDGNGYVIVPGVEFRQLDRRIPVIETDTDDMLADAANWARQNDTRYFIWWNDGKTYDLDELEKTPVEDTSKKETGFKSLIPSDWNFQAPDTSDWDFGAIIGTIIRVGLAALLIGLTIHQMRKQNLGCLGNGVAVLAILFGVLGFFWWGALIFGYVLFALVYVIGLFIPDTGRYHDSYVRWTTPAPTNTNPPANPPANQP